MTDVSVMKGLTMASVVNLKDRELVFNTTDGRRFRLFHYQDCCESVSIDDICGDLTDLVGEPLLVAEEVNSEPPKRETGEYVPESETWTFYKFATRKGYVDVRWYGTSTGYYSESVSFEEVEE